MDNKELGSRIAELRKQNNLSQKEEGFSGYPAASVYWSYLSVRDNFCIP